MTEEQLISEVLRRANMLMKDDDFFDDIRDPVVERAIAHWTLKNRLSPEEADMFHDHYKVVGVFNKLNNVQGACRQLNVGCPIDELLGRNAAEFELRLRVALDARKKEPAVSTTSKTDTTKPSTTAPSSTVPVSALKPSSAGKTTSSTIPLQPSTVIQQAQSSNPSSSSQLSNPATPRPMVTFDSEVTSVSMPSSKKEPQSSILQKVFDRMFSLAPRNVARWWSFQVILIVTLLLNAYIDNVPDGNNNPSQQQQQQQSPIDTSEL
jgi:hypothetical protein